MFMTCPICQELLTKTQNPNVWVCMTCQVIVNVVPQAGNPIHK